MKKQSLLLAVITSMLTLSVFAADLEANSLIQCEEAFTISEAIENLNLTLASPTLSIASPIKGEYYRMQNYVSSPPTITKLENNRFSVCVTLTRKGGWLSSAKK